MKKIILLVSIAVTFSGSVLAEPTPRSPAKIQNTADMITCNGEYALCSQVVCKVTNYGESAASHDSKPSEIGRALCSCPVYVGRNLGGTQCHQRREATRNDEVYSDYSPIHLLGSKPADTQIQQAVSAKIFDPGYVCQIPEDQEFHYADCMDIKCKKDPSNPEKALCNCPIYQNKKSGGAFMMEASSCAKATELCKFVTSGEDKITNNSSPTVFGYSVIEKSLFDYFNTLVTPSMLCGTSKYKKDQLQELLNSKSSS